LSEAWTNNPSPFNFHFVDDQGQPFTTTPYPLPVLEGYLTDGVNVYPVDMEDNLDGTYSMWYTVTAPHTAAGSGYQLYVTANSVQVIGSPFSVTVSGPSPLTSYANGTGTSNGFVNEAKAVVIHGKDVNGVSIPFGGDNFMVKVYRGNTLFEDGTFSDNYNGTYTYQFTPNANGSWTIEIWLDDVLIETHTPVFN
jgi:hypothetical protein